MQFRDLALLALVPVVFGRALPDDNEAPAAPGGNTVAAPGAAAPNNSGSPDPSADISDLDTESTETFRKLVRWCDRAQGFGPNLFHDCIWCMNKMGASFPDETYRSLSQRMDLNNLQSEEAFKQASDQIQPMFDALAQLPKCQPMLAQMETISRNLQVGQMGAPPQGASGAAAPAPDAAAQPLPQAPQAPVAQQ